MDDREKSARDAGLMAIIRLVEALILDALESMSRGRLHSGPLMTEGDFKGIASVALERFRSITNHRPAIPTAELEAVRDALFGAIQNKDIVITINNEQGHRVWSSTLNRLMGE